MEATFPTSSVSSSLRDRLAIFRRFLWLALVPGLLTFLLVAAIALLLPPSYRSSAILLVEQQEIPQDLVRSTITTYVTQRFEAIQRRVMTRATLLDLIEKYELYPDDIDDEPSEVLLEQFDGDMSIEPLSIQVVDPRSGRPTQATSAFELTFDSRSPTKAFAVLNELISLLLEENARNREAQAEGTAAFLEEEAARLEGQIEVLGDRLAEFKERNVNNLPELLDLNYRLLERAENEIEETRRQMAVLDEQIVYLQAELDQLNPYDVLYGEDGQRILNSRDRVKALEAQLASLVNRYSEDHPDIVRLRQEISGLRADVGERVGDGNAALRAELQVQRDELARIRERYADDHPEVQLLEEVIRQLEAALRSREGADQPVVDRPTSPAYISLQARIQSARVRRESLVQTLEDQRARIRQYEARIVRTPQIEKEYASLSQDYQNTRAKYQEIQTRKLEAELAESLEEERKGERLVLIEPPSVPEVPVSPNRILLMAAGVVAGVAVAFGTVMVAHSLDGSVFGARAVSGLVGAAPIGLIPVMYTPEELRRRRRRLVQAAVVAVVAFLVLLVLVHFLVSPLPTLWYVFLARLGL